MPGNLITISKTFSLDIYQIQAELIFTNYSINSAIMWFSCNNTRIFIISIPHL